jgi:hypothetical protein
MRLGIYARGIDAPQESHDNAEVDTQPSDGGFRRHTLLLCSLMIPVHTIDDRVI